jgi:hypothetical protein
MRNCKGCTKLKNVVCLFRHWRNTVGCPCKDCLVKVMCSNELSCKEREQAIILLINRYEFPKDNERRNNEKVQINL